MTATLSTTTVNGQVDWLAGQLNSGYLRIYDGSRPANANTTVTSQVLLAELRFNATAFGAAVAGVITANALTRDESANAGGTATWCRILKSDGTTVMFDGSVGATGSGENLEMVSTTIVSGAPVEVSTFTYTVEPD